MVDNDDALLLDDDENENDVDETEELPEDVLEPLGETYAGEAQEPGSVPVEEDTAPYASMILITTAAYAGALGLVLWWLRDYIGGA